MKNKKIHNITSPGFKTPQGYFDAVEEDIFKNIKLKSAVKYSGHKVPETYFDSFDDALISRLETEKDTKVLPLFPLKKIIAFTAIAASLVFLFGLTYNTDTSISFDTLETVSIENYLEDEDYTNYELASLLTEDELIADNFIDTYILEDHIEDYLLNQSDLEDLITE